MADHRLLIAARWLEQMRQHARAAAPQECCGLLVGRRDPVAIVTRLVPTENLHPEPSRFFTIDPAQHIALLRQLRDGGAEMLLGHYHSHPNGPPAPSPRDLAEANDPDMLWLVIATDSGAIGAFQPKCDERGRIDGFAPLSVIVAP